MDVPTFLAKANSLAQLQLTITQTQHRLANPNGFYSEAGLAHIKHMLAHSKKTALTLKRELQAMLS